LQKHKQDVSDAYIFSSTPNQTDYDFLKKNVNLQFFINGFLFTTSNYLYIASTETSAKKIELHIKNKTSTEIDLHQNSAIEKTTITYDDFLLTLTSEEEGESKTEEYNFKIDVTNNHYYTLVFTSYTIGRDLAFYTPGVESIPLLLSPYD
jgi:hypothetical protein